MNYRLHTPEWLLKISSWSFHVGISSEVDASAAASSRLPSPLHVARWQTAEQRALSRSPSACRCCLRPLGHPTLRRGQQQGQWRSPMLLARLVHTALRGTQCVGAHVRRHTFYVCSEAYRVRGYSYTNCSPPNLCKDIVQLTLGKAKCQSDPWTLRRLWIGSEGLRFTSWVNVGFP